MNSALKQLSESNPKLFQAFMEALTEDLGFNNSVVCPQCNSRLELRLAEAAKPSSGKGSRKGSRKGTTLNDYLVELAKIRKATVGKINSEYRKVIGDRAKKLTLKQFRAQKLEWAKKELGKHRRVA